MHDVHALHDTPKAAIMQNMHPLKTMQTMHFMHPSAGVLAYDRDRAVFVAFELDAGSVTAQQQRDIARVGSVRGPEGGAWKIDGIAQAAETG